MTYLDVGTNYMELAEATLDACLGDAKFIDSVVQHNALMMKLVRDAQRGLWFWDDGGIT
jgi:rhamnogalacturonyl hydrolase YesR